MQLTRVWLHGRWSRRLLIALPLGGWFAATVGAMAAEATAVEATAGSPLAGSSNSALTIVPFAVPVATPVAVVNPGGVLYSYAPYAETDPAVGGTIAAERTALWREFEEFRRWKESRGPAESTASRAAAAETMVARNCARCHSGASPQGGFALDRPLSSDDRLRAMRAVLSGTMPKNQTLAAQDVGRVLQELAGENRKSP